MRQIPRYHRMGHERFRAQLLSPKRFATCHSCHRTSISWTEAASSALKRYSMCSSGKGRRAIAADLLIRSGSLLSKKNATGRRKCGTCHTQVRGHGAATRALDVLPGKGDESPVEFRCR
jgi:hypothetical protein